MFVGASFDDIKDKVVTCARSVFQQADEHRIGYIEIDYCEELLCEVCETVDIPIPPQKFISKSLSFMDLTRDERLNEEEFVMFVNATIEQYIADN